MYLCASCHLITLSQRQYTGMWQLWLATCTECMYECIMLQPDLSVLFGSSTSVRCIQKSPPDIYATRCIIANLVIEHIFLQPIQCYEWMIGVLGHDSALCRLYWAGDNQCDWDEFYYESCPWRKIDRSTCWPAVQRATTVPRMPVRWYFIITNSDEIMHCDRLTVMGFVVLFVCLYGNAWLLDKYVLILRYLIIMNTYVIWWMI